MNLLFTRMFITKAWEALGPATASAGWALRTSGGTNRPRAPRLAVAAWVGLLVLTACGHGQGNAAEQPAVDNMEMKADTMEQQADAASNAMAAGMMENMLSANDTDAAGGNGDTEADE